MKSEPLAAMLVAASVEHHTGMRWGSCGHGTPPERDRKAGLGVGDVTSEEIDALLARMKLQFRQIDQALRRLASRLPAEKDAQIAGEIRAGLQDAVRYTAVWAQLADAYPTVSVIRRLEAALNRLSAIVLRLQPYL